MFGFGEGGRLGEVVYDESGLGVAIVHGGKRGEAFLASCIPYFKLYDSVWQGDLLCQESSYRNGVSAVRR